MIRLTDRLPAVTLPDAAYFKIRSTFDCYADPALFWVQDDGKAYFSMLDGHINIAYYGGDLEEIKAFLQVMAPCSVFSDAATLQKLGLSPFEKAFLLTKKSTEPGKPDSEPLSSRQIYDLFSQGGLTVGDYPAFAVDLCRRLNHGWAHCTGLAGKCAAVTLCSGDFCLINGIVSLQKGCGGKVLQSALRQNYGKTCMALCREELKGFYEKYGFQTQNLWGYWVKD